MKILLVILILLIAAGGAGYLLWSQAGQTGTTPVEAWVGRRLTDIINAHIEPRFSFSSIDYQAPKTFAFQNVDLVAGEQSILSADRLNITLAGIPRQDEPMVIERVEIDSPSVQLIRTADGGLVGWRGFVKQEVLDNPQSVPQDRRLSDVLKLEFVAVHDASLTYVPSSNEADQMSLDDIEFELKTPKIASEATDGNEASLIQGAYAVNGTLKRDPLFQIDIDGRINLDTALLEMTALKGKVALDEQQYKILPPRVQEFVRAHQVHGAVDLELSGRFSLNDPQSSEANLNAQIRDTGFTTGASRWPISRCDIAVTLASNRLNAQVGAEMLSGRLDSEWRLELINQQPLNMRWKVEGMQLEELLAQLSRQNTQFAARMHSEGQVSTDLKDILNQLNGAGQLSLREGNLVEIPVIKELMALARKVKLVAPKTPSDRLDTSFDIKPDRLVLREAELQSGVVAVRGNGPIYFDGRLALEARTTGVEQLTKGLGKIGEIVGSVGDRVVTYEVNGNVEQPVVKVKPLGLGR